MQSFSCPKHISFLNVKLLQSIETVEGTVVLFDNQSLTHTKSYLNFYLTFSVSPGMRADP